MGTCGLLCVVVGGSGGGGCSAFCGNGCCATGDTGCDQNDDCAGSDECTDVGGTIGARVLSTPGMIGAMERAGAELAIQGLPDGKATVGFEVCIKHVAPAAAESICVASAMLREVDGRKLRFDVEVTEGERTIGVGTHERRVIDVPVVRGGGG